MPSDQPFILKESAMSNTPQTSELDVNLDELDFDSMLGDLADTAVAGGFDGSSGVDDCEGGACKI